MNRVGTVLIVMVLILIMVIGCGQKQTKEQLYAEAERYEREDNFDKAIKSFEALVTNYPQSEKTDSVLFRIGQIYSNNLADFTKSVQIHERLVSTYPASKLAAQSLFMIGYHFANNIGDLDSARIYYEKFIEKYPDHELIASVQWELDHLGMDINEINFFRDDSAEKN